MAMFRGFSFPFRKLGSQLPVPAVDNDLIRESLYQIVMTSRGERVMRPDFGTTAWASLFENNDAVLEENLRTSVLNSISKYEPRVIVTAISAVREDTTLRLDIAYIVRATREPQLLAIPLGTT